MTGWIIVAVVAIVVIAIVVVAIKWYNQFVELQNRVDNQSSQIDVQLKRRADLIPNLVEVTREYATHEKDTLSEVTKLRNTMQNAPDAGTAYKAGQALGAIGRRLIAIAENYPELKANANFLSLQTELSETEDKISVARQFYNDTVMKYNTAVMTFPKSIIAKACGFGKLAQLEVSEEDKKPIRL